MGGGGLGGGAVGGRGDPSRVVVRQCLFLLTRMRHSYT